jgi:3-hydroxyacyl-[acyl-carrier-protein] dehydratase
VDIHEILKFLPHRYPFLLVDRIVEFEKEKSMYAIKNVTINEPFFSGHFPAKPVMPGVLIIEALAQTGGILAYKSTDWNPETSLFYLGSIENARFKKMVIPGDQLHLKIIVNKKRTNVWKFSAEASVDNEVVCSADMTCVEGKVS